MHKIIICLLGLVVLTTGQRITTIHLDGVQYFISRMNPYSPELNYFLAYQYCRSLGLQLASFETKEKAESMTTYLKNAGYGNYDFWTSGNRLGTGMFLWMSTGLPFNATFDFFENSADAIQAGLLDPIDHNSNTAPQRTARDSSSGAEKGCVILKQPTLKWMPEDCSAVKDFICEQTRCYYYNYGSIPVSSAQGRPIITTTTPRYTIDSKLKTDYPRILPSTSTTTTTIPSTTSALPLLSMSTLASLHSRRNSNQPSYVSLKLDQERALNSIKSHSSYQRLGLKHHSSMDLESDSEAEARAADDNDGGDVERESERDSDIELAADADADDGDSDVDVVADADDSENVDNEAEAEVHLDQKLHHSADETMLIKDLRNYDENLQTASASTSQQQANSNSHENVDQLEQERKKAFSETDKNAITGVKGNLKENSSEQNSNSLNRKQYPGSSSGPTVTALPNDINQKQYKTESTPSVEERLKQIAQEVEKRNQEENRHIPSLAADIGLDDIGHQSFLSLSDLIRTLRPNDKQIIPQIDSDYSNAMRVLGEKSVVVNNEQQRQQYQ